LIWPGTRYNVNSKIWTWSTGETLKLAHFGVPSDYQNY